MEKVFCLSRVDLEQIFTFPFLQGIILTSDFAVIFSQPHHFLPRSQAEKNSAFKQIIPYQLFCCNQRYFVFRRGSRVGEQRLSGRLSLGVGGHINDQDSTDGKHLSLPDFQKALARERHEELLCPEGVSTLFKGWINDDSDAVGQVHLGAVHLCKVKNKTDVTIRPDGEDLQEVGWLSVDEIRERQDEFEKWSWLALKPRRPKRPRAERHL